MANVYQASFKYNKKYIALVNIESIKNSFDKNALRKILNREFNTTHCMFKNSKELDIEEIKEFTKNQILEDNSTYAVLYNLSKTHDLVFLEEFDWNTFEYGNNCK